MNRIKYLENKSILINDCMLNTNMPNLLHIRLKKKNVQIIKGTVYTTHHSPYKGVIVEVIQISGDDCKRIVLGYTLTDEGGEYAIAIEAKCFAIYELAVYMPLLS
jgi:hypothetical protein